MPQQVFDGIKVVEMSFAQAGPMIPKILGEFGATVIHVETSKHLDVIRTMAPYKDQEPGLNRSGFYAMVNNNKYGITLNLDHPKGLEIAKRLILWADIFLENFRPGVVAKWGFSYDDIKKIKPSIIMVSTCMQGQTGPHRYHPGYGGQLVSLTGFTHLTGWPDRMPTQPYSAYTDIIGPRFVVGALAAALIQRNRTGKGQYFDVSQYEAGIHFISPLLIDYTVGKRIASRVGNRCEYAAPHGAYPCQGKDRWCAITVFTDAEWQSFCQVLGSPPWTKDNKFATLLARKQNEEELDRLVAAWTLNFTPDEVMHRLQTAGIPAGVVKTAQEIFADPQLNHRHHFKELEHAEIGRHLYYDESFKLSKTPSSLHMAAPCQGQHNEYVYTKILGMSDEEFVVNLSEGVFD